MLTHDEVCTLFKNLETGDSGKFFARVSDDVHWTVMGTHPLAGVYHTKKAVLEATFGRLNRMLKKNILIIIKHIYVDDKTAIIEMESLATAKNNKPYKNAYCWVVEFNDKKIITTVRAHVDSALVQQLVLENE